MSLLSRSTGGRRTARLAAVFAGTLLMYLVVTAVPAFAATVCTSGTVDAANDKLIIAVGTDDSVIVASDGTNWDVNVNGGGFDFAGAGGCPVTGTVAAVQWIQITGSDAGAESVIAYDPGGDFANINTTVNLGNGVDTFVFDYAALGALPDAGDANLGLGTAADGSINGGEPISGIADFRIDNAEKIVVNGSDDAVGAGDQVSLADNSQAGFSAVTGTADDTQTTTGPVKQNVTFNGGSGDDTLVSGLGDDNFVGGAGADTISYEGATTAITANLQTGNATGMGADTLTDVQNVTGGPKNDLIIGNTLNNTLLGGAGDDQIAGFTGDDTIDGEDGSDTVTENGPGANGADLISDSGTGVDDVDTLDYSVARTTDTIVVPGGGAVSGNDANSDGTSEEKDNVSDEFEVIMTGSGNDTVDGTLNADGLTILTGGGQDLITGSPDGDTIDAGTGVNQVDGAAGTDTLDFSSQTGPTTTSQQTVPFFGTPTEVWVAKSDSPAFVNAFASVETVIATGQDDLVQWDGTAPALFNFAADGGTDTIDASTAAAAVVLNLSNYGVGTCPCNEVENAIGGAGNDTLTGNVLNNVLTGNDGADVISAGTGNDTVEGGLGNDTLTDGGGADTLVYRNAPSGETIDTANGFASGGDGDDTLSGNFETVLGSDFADNITAGQTAFDLPGVIKGFGGNDNITGSNSTDTLAGGKGNDNVHGGGGDDTIKGSGGNDTLLGSSGDDTIKGGNGNDSLVGGRGYDVGNGGKGKDTCKQIEVAHSC